MKINTLSHIALALLSLVLLSLLAVPAIAAEVAPDTSLDGTIYSVTMDPGDKAWDNEITFQDGMFHSVVCDEYGFSATPYASNAAGQSITFEARGASDTNGTSHWQGTVIGSKISGTLTWTQPDKDPTVHPFEGQLRD